MAELQTRPTDASVEDFIASLNDSEVEKDCHVILKMMQKATGEKPVMWGPRIIGFGSQNIKYADGRELDWPIIAFSPRKQTLTLYIMSESNRDDPLFKKLGKHSTSKACLYIKRLSDVNMEVLEQLINDAAKT